jgi:uncharacterized surface protein with fasciclin (FAS1) repeats
MPDTGAPWNIPYVEATDLVRDWPTDSEALAEAIADGLDAAGIVKQVVSVIPTTMFSTTSSSFVDVTNYTASITPTADDSTILGFIGCRYSNTTGSTSSAQILRDATAISLSNNDETFSNPSANGSFEDIAVFFTDSPATTSALTYKLQIKTSAGQLHIGRRGADTGGQLNGSLVLVEVAA